MQIMEVPLDIIVPHQSIGVVMLQPFLEIDFNNEPFVWVENKSNQQIAFIERTLQLAINRPANQHVNFTVFPEYSVPGINGIAAIERILADNQWPVNAVVIAGVDGLDKAQYAGLFDGETETIAHEENLPDRVAADEWINCCITWVKTNDGLRRWIQPKLAPAQLENNVVAQRMFRGQGVFVFKGTFDNRAECRFLTCLESLDLGPPEAIIPFLLEHQPGFSEQMFDQFLSESLPKLNAYVVAPMVAYQRPRVSSIWNNGHEDYTSIFEVR